MCSCVFVLGCWCVGVDLRANVMEIGHTCVIVAAVMCWCVSGVVVLSVVVVVMRMLMLHVVG